MKPYYQDSAVTIYHGDCRELAIPPVDAVIADPPYGIGFASQPTTGGRRRYQPKETWDDEPFDSMELLKLLWFGEVQCVWGGNYFELPQSRGWLSWYKPDAPPSMASIELAWTNQDQNSRQLSCSISQTNPERLGHPTQKPLTLMLWCIQQLPFAETILDPFMGSGTTLRAAKDFGRKAVGIEISEAYCEIAAKRMAQEVFAL